MGRQAGYFEWDDDSLTPGQKAEGGWSQNLFNSAGKLRASARFIPDDELSDDYYQFSSNAPPDEGSLSGGQQVVAAVLTEIITGLADLGIAHAKPHVSRMWNAIPKPGIPWRRRSKGESSVPPEEALSGDWRSQSRSCSANEISAAEARARMLAATAAQSFAEWQLRIVSDAEIVENGHVVDQADLFSTYSEDDLTYALELLAGNPALLSEEQLAGLASVLLEHPLALRAAFRQARWG